MSRKVLHLSRIIRRGDCRITSTACNRHRLGNDGANIADSEAEVTCKFCLAIIANRPAKDTSHE